MLEFTTILVSPCSHEFSARIFWEQKYTAMRSPAPRTVNRPQPSTWRTGRRRQRGMTEFRHRGRALPAYRQLWLFINCLWVFWMQTKCRLKYHSKVKLPTLRSWSIIKIGSPGAAAFPYFCHFSEQIPNSRRNNKTKNLKVYKEKIPNTTGSPYG